MPDLSLNPVAAAQPCALPGCSSGAEVQWQRRIDADATAAVYGCGPHAISLALAAHVHAADCTAPEVALLPGCGCTPEPLPDPTPLPGDQPTVTLPTGWTVPAT